MLPLAARAATVPAAAIDAANARLVALEQEHGGRLGVAIGESGGNLTIAHRADELFPMCSTFKFLAAAAILKRVDAGAEHLDRAIAYGQADLLSYAPIAKRHVAEGQMALGDLCAAAIQWSDNTAANLMLRELGGPSAITRFARDVADRVTRLDRTEPTLNTAIPGDVRDTTSPAAMQRDLDAILLDDRLSAASRAQLETWMIGNQVAGKRLRAGLPPSWRIGDKTGTGDNGTANTIAMIRPPSGTPILATVYYTGSSESPDVLNSVHAEIGRIIAQVF
ncbi:class A beta-lactamase [Methylovirgula sp. 4M-Z18]|nr:class A beta-lactamase [Methylovirgula sp. 4M-Z18]